MNKKLNTLVLFFFLSSTMISFAQTSFQYDAKGNRIARIINLGKKDVLADAAINDSLQGEPELPKPLQWLFRPDYATDFGQTVPL